MSLLRLLAIKKTIKTISSTYRQNSTHGGEGCSVGGTTYTRMNDGGWQSRGTKIARNIHKFIYRFIRPDHRSAGAKCRTTRLGRTTKRGTNTRNKSRSARHRQETTDTSKGQEPHLTRTPKLLRKEGGETRRGLRPHPAELRPVAAQVPDACRQPSELPSRRETALSTGCLTRSTDRFHVWHRRSPHRLPRSCSPHNRNHIYRGKIFGITLFLSFRDQFFNKINHFVSAGCTFCSRKRQVGRCR